MSITGVYFEKILKKSNSDIWLRNIQLGVHHPVLKVVSIPHHRLMCICVCVSRDTGMTSILLSVGAVFLSGVGQSQCCC